MQRAPQRAARGRAASTVAPAQTVQAAARARGAGKGGVSDSDAGECCRGCAQTYRPAGIAHALGVLALAGELAVARCGAGASADREIRSAPMWQGGDHQEARHHGARHTCAWLSQLLPQAGPAAGQPWTAASLRHAAATPQHCARAAGRSTDPAILRSSSSRDARASAYMY